MSGASGAARRLLTEHALLGPATADVLLRKRNDNTALALRFRGTTARARTALDAAQRALVRITVSLTTHGIKRAWSLEARPRSKRCDQCHHEHRGGLATEHRGGLATRLTSRSPASLLERVGSEASGAPCYDGGSVMRHDQHALRKKERERGESLISIVK